jgi:hypothetical protein
MALASLGQPSTDPLLAHRFPHPARPLDFPTRTTPPPLAIYHPHRLYIPPLLFSIIQFLLIDLDCRPVVATPSSDRLCVVSGCESDV